MLVAVSRDFLYHTVPTKFDSLRKSGACHDWKVLKGTRICMSNFCLIFAYIKYTYPYLAKNTSHGTVASALNVTGSVFFAEIRLIFVTV